ncbi:MULTISPECIES: hypothetical protein [Cyanophyceae]|nr:hypothetical protein [Trichocoleus sp. FACHB-40]MBD2003508.1 hypothetical protein [Trichocoleus sp. FACHB-40]
MNQVFQPSNSSAETITSSNEPHATPEESRLVQLLDGAIAVSPFVNFY